MPPALATVKRRSIQRPRPQAFLLEVTEGPDRGASITLSSASAARVLVGQSPACTMQLRDSEVSRRHLAISYQDQRLALLDLGSTNGTMVNGVFIKEVWLEGGETIQLGATTIRVEAEDATGQAKAEMRDDFGRLLGRSAAMKRLYAVLQRAAMTDAPLLIEGEAGVGKTLAAEDVHAKSARAANAFVVLERSVASDECERALFGDADKPGLVTLAKGGTLYIAEVGELPRSVQNKLVEILQSTDTLDVRVIAATRRDLDRDVTEGRFDERLFDLLVAGRVEMPPLRERLEDVRIIAEQTWRALAGGSDRVPHTIPSDFVPRLQGYAWPGNVRELKGAVLARFAEQDAAMDLAKLAAPSLDFIENVVSRDLPFTRARAIVAAQFERMYVERVVAQHGGNVTRAAHASGLAYRYFQFIRARLK